MNTEISILIDIYEDLCHKLEHINSSKNNMLKIENNIKKLDNNYFEMHCNSSLLDGYMLNNVETYNELANNLETAKLFIKNKIINSCSHEWIYDTIDIGPDSSQNICYCVKCEVTKK